MSFAIDSEQVSLCSAENGDKLRPNKPKAIRSQAINSFLDIYFSKERYCWACMLFFSRTLLHILCNYSHLHLGASQYKHCCYEHGCTGVPVFSALLKGTLTVATERGESKSHPEILNYTLTARLTFGSMVNVHCSMTLTRNLQVSM